MESQKASQRGACWARSRDENVHIDYWEASTGNHLWYCHYKDRLR